MVSGADTAAPGWRAIRAFLRSVARLVLWTVVLIGGLSVFLAWAPRIGAALNHVSRGESIQIYVALVVMAFVLLALVTMLSRKGPISWAALHAGLLAAMAAAIYWLPGWSGTLAASSFVLLIVIRAPRCPSPGPEDGPLSHCSENQVSSRYSSPQESRQGFVVAFMGTSPGRDYMPVWR